MKKKITLRTIIESVLEDKNVKDDSNTYEANIKNLNRAFNRLIEKLGNDKEILKRGQRYFEFEESEVPFIKVLLSQLYDNKGIIAEFTNERKRNKKFNSTEVNELIESLKDIASNEGMDENEINRMVDFFSTIFLMSPLRIVEYCHTLINALADTLQDLDYYEQAKYLLHVEHVLKKEYALRTAEFIFNTGELAHIVEEYRKKNGGDAHIYSEYESELRFSYIQRDRCVLEAIQEDDDLREYIEKKFGKKAEDIFNYAVLDT